MKKTGFIFILAVTLVAFSIPLSAQDNPDKGEEEFKNLELSFISGRLVPPHRFNLDNTSYHAGVEFMYLFNKTHGIEIATSFSKPDYSLDLPTSEETDLDYSVPSEFRASTEGGFDSIETQHPDLSTEDGTIIDSKGLTDTHRLKEKGELDMYFAYLDYVYNYYYKDLKVSFPMGLGYVGYSGNIKKTVILKDITGNVIFKGFETYSPESDVFVNIGTSIDWSMSENWGLKVQLKDYIWKGTEIHIEKFGENSLKEIREDASGHTLNVNFGVFYRF